MIIPCRRCNKELDKPDNRNAYYIIAGDTKRLEGKSGDITPQQIQATGIICKECLRKNDFIIWGKDV